MATSRRQKQSRGARLLEGGVLGGGAVGLYLASSRLSHHPARPARCPSTPGGAGACMGHATNLALQPMVVGGFAGAFVGLLLAVGLLLLWRGVQKRIEAPRARVGR